MLLDAVLDVHDLVRATNRQLLHVPWREDARPVSGVLHGAFAHLSMAEMWEGVERSDVDSVDIARAATLSRRYAAWSAAALETLLSSGALTPLGERFVLRLAERVRHMRNST